MQANIIQERLRKVYDKYKILPPINSYVSSNIDDKVKEKDLQLEFLPCCYRKLSWYSDTIEQLDSFESKRNLEDVSNKRSKVIARKPFLLDQYEIERKYRNFDSQSLKLHPCDFSIEYRHKIKKLKDFQSLLIGQTNMLVKNRDFLDKLDEEINKRDDARVRDQYQSLLAKDAMRDRFSKIMYPETYIEIETDRKRKLPSSFLFITPRQSSDSAMWRPSKSESTSVSDRLPELAPTSKLTHAFLSTNSLKSEHPRESSPSFEVLPQILSPDLSKIYEEVEEFINTTIVLFEEPFIRGIARHLPTRRKQSLDEESKSLVKSKHKKGELNHISSIASIGCCKKKSSKKV